MKPDKNIPKIQYFIVLLLIATSGFTSIIFLTSIFLPILFIVSLVYFLINKNTIDKYFVIMVCALSVITIVQTIQFSFFSFESTVSLFIIFLSSYFTVKTMKINFLKIYINLLVIITMISLIFWGLTLLFPLMPNYFIENYASFFKVETNTFFEHAPTILIYTFNFDYDSYGIYRNSGPFWEPGAFAGFLIIAIIFNIVLTNKINNKKNLWLLIGLLTTFSTTGYIAASFLLFTYFFIKNKFSYRIISFPIFLIIAFYSYNNIPFLGEKIDTQLTGFNTGSVDYQYRTRFVSAALDIYDFLQYPFFGKGKNQVTRFSEYADYAGILKHRNNGVTDFLVQYGLFGFILFFGMMYYSFRTILKKNNYNEVLSIFILISIFIIGFSEKYFNRPVFVSLIFLGIYYLPEIITKTKKNNNEK